MKESQVTEERGVGPGEYITSWERMGIEIGLQQGRLEGIQEGERKTLRDVLIDILTTRFGTIEAAHLNRILTIESIDELRQLTHHALTAPNIDALGI